MTTTFINAVANHELAKVRMMLSNELLIDPRGGTFSEMLACAKENLEDLFEMNKESDYEIPSDNTQWDKTLAYKVKNDLNSNFSIEKLALFQELAMWVGKDKAADMDEEELSRKRQPDDNSDNTDGNTIHTETKQSSFNTGKVSGTIATVGGAVLSIYAISAGKFLLGVIGGGAIIVGGIILYVSKNRK